MNNNFNLKSFLAEGVLLNEIKVNKPNTSGLEVKWTPEYYTAIEDYGDRAYNEKGLADGFEMVDGKKVKEIIGYYNEEGDNEEEIDIIGYIYSTSEKDIESYSEEDLDDAFMNALNEE